MKNKNFDSFFFVWIPFVLNNNNKHKIKMTNITFLEIFYPIFSCLFFFFLTIFYLDDFCLSKNRWIKYGQIIIFVLSILLFIRLIYDGLNYLIYKSIINIKPEDNTDITLKGKVVISKEAGEEIAKGFSNLGSNIGLGATVGATSASVAKVIAKSSIPPVQKTGLIIASAALGGAIHAGVTAINSQTTAVQKLKESTVKSSESPISKDINKFIDAGNNDSPLDILLNSISLINTICICLTIILFVQISFKFFMSEKPKLYFINKILPLYSNSIKLYIYKLIKLNKNINNIYIFYTLLLLFISLFFSEYFIINLLNNLDDYIKVWIELHKK